MNIPIYYAAGALVLGYIFGAAITHLCDKYEIEKHRKDAARIKADYNCFVQCCRDYIPTNFWNRVYKVYEKRVAYLLGGVK